MIDRGFCKEIEKIEKPKQELRFSKRELEFAKLLCLPDSEIAKRLIVAPTTAKTHIHNMRVKMISKNLPLNGSMRFWLFRQLQMQKN